jgi:hypothetical protein
VQMARPGWLLPAESETVAGFPREVEATRAMFHTCGACISRM